MLPSWGGRCTWSLWCPCRTVWSACTASTPPSHWPWCLWPPPGSLPSCPGSPAVTTVRRSSLPAGSPTTAATFSVTQIFMAITGLSSLQSRLANRQHSKARYSGLPSIAQVLVFMAASRPPFYQSTRQQHCKAVLPLAYLPALLP